MGNIKRLNMQRDFCHKINTLKRICLMPYFRRVDGDPVENE